MSTKKSKCCESCLSGDCFGVNCECHTPISSEKEEKCACGEIKLLDGAGVEINGVWHSKNPCYYTNPPTPKPVDNEKRCKYCNTPLWGRNEEECAHKEEVGEKCLIHCIGIQDHKCDGKNCCRCGEDLSFTPPLEVKEEGSTKYDDKWLEETMTKRPLTFKEVKLLLDTVISKTIQETEARVRGELVEKYEKVKKILEYIASRNELHNAVCIPKAKEALEIISLIEGEK